MIAHIAEAHPEVPAETRTVLEDCLANAANARERQATAVDIESRKYFEEIAAMWERMAETIRRSGLSDVPVTPTSNLSQNKETDSD